MAVNKADIERTAEEIYIRLVVAAAGTSGVKTMNVDYLRTAKEALKAASEFHHAK